MSILDKTYHDISKSLNGEVKIWCDEDNHKLFEYFSDFNEWLDGDEGQLIRIDNNLEGLSQPSKAFYAGDPEAYNQVFKIFRQEQQERILSKTHISDTFGDEHWFDKNESRFEQLMECLEGKTVVPFIGAGLSVDGGFPAWNAHLRQQGKTSGINPDHVDDLINQGKYEEVIEEIEAKGFRDAFIQELKDVFSKTGKLTDTTWRISELFNDTILTTNYDHLIEQAFETGGPDKLQVLDPTNILEDPEINKTTIIKLHGDIKKPTQCILGKNQYDETYGNTDLDLKKPIPKILSYHYKTSNLLFLGSSLYQDRTMQVFKAIKDEMNKAGDIDRPAHFCLEAMPEEETELVERNAYLTNYGIIPIWFPKGQYDFIEQILRLAKNEMRYRGHDLGKQMNIPNKEEQKQVNVIPSEIVVTEKESLWESVRNFFGI
ncbi:SIR2 family NAD-dependent protein deacylase [Winogradskyella vidalii]|uniref:SIR2 family NAD-dependent protein deacylase n=1 Tax=Winogradskyella vidalii TaxID=2615024 RepID=UPI0015C7F9B0|nr:SIR2 family protein [Winogradskyella vidalii]